MDEAPDNSLLQKVLALFGLTSIACPAFVEHVLGPLPHHSFGLVLQRSIQKILMGVIPVGRVEQLPYSSHINPIPWVLLRSQADQLKHVGPEHLFASNSGYLGGLSDYHDVRIDFHVDNPVD